MYKNNEEMSLKEEELRLKYHNKLKELVDSYDDKDLKAILITVFANRAKNRSCLTCSINYSCSHFVSECIYNDLLTLNVPDMRVKLTEYVD